MQRLARHIAVCRNDGGTVIVAHRNLTGVARHGYRETAGRIRGSVEHLCNGLAAHRTRIKRIQKGIRSIFDILDAVCSSCDHNGYHRLAKAGKLCNQFFLCCRDVNLCGVHSLAAVHRTAAGSLGCCTVCIEHSSAETGRRTADNSYDHIALCCKCQCFCFLVLVSL